MVRKRSRTSRKYYDSDDNDSDSDFELEDVRAQPAQKKYSLRQRKKALFIDDYDYEDDDEILPIPPTKARSDDEDFEVENEIAGEETKNVYVYTNRYEDPTEDPNGLIDFEDMIRADIVVNKNRIDYDNIIDKTEIKMQPINGGPSPVKRTGAKRGRKPKKRPESETSSNCLEPEAKVQDIESCEDKTDSETILKQSNHTSDTTEFEPKEKTQEECSVEKDDEKPEANSEIESNAQESQMKTQEDTPEFTESEDSNINSQESVIKFNENYVQKSLHLNGTVFSTNSEDLSEINDLVDPLLPEDEDDDVVFVEDQRAEIIVLDD